MVTGVGGVDFDASVQYCGLLLHDTRMKYSFSISVTVSTKSDGRLVCQGG